MHITYFYKTLFHDRSVSPELNSLLFSLFEGKYIICPHRLCPHLTSSSYISPHSSCSSQSNTTYLLSGSLILTHVSKSSWNLDALTSEHSSPSPPPSPITCHSSRNLTPLPSLSPREKKSWEPHNKYLSVSIPLLQPLISCPSSHFVPFPSFLITFCPPQGINATLLNPLIYSPSVACTFYGNP